nr:TonB-dependent receptor [Polymorphobacter sp.]
MTHRSGKASRAAPPLWLLALVAAPLHAQQAAPAPVVDAETEDTIVVTANRDRGKVAGDIAPEIQLGPQDIRAIGAGSIEELLQELSPQTRSGRGRGGDAPVVLINGKRVSGFAEIRNIPPEAIERVDIMPEEVALRFGYRADQRVVNFVLRERFRAVTTELELGGPSAGDRTSAQAEANFLRIRNGTRLSLEAEYAHDSMLLESDRNITATQQGRPYSLGGNVTAPIFGAEIDPALSALAGSVATVAAAPTSAATTAPRLADFALGANAANTTNIGPYRTLLPETRALKLGSSYATTIFGDVAATLSTGLEKTDSESLLGLPVANLTLPVGNPYSPFGAETVLSRYGEGALVRANNSWNGRIGLAFNGRIMPWAWGLTANYSHAENDTLTDRGISVTAAQARLSAADPAYNPFGPDALAGPLIQDRAQSNTETGDAQLVTNGALFALPGGDVAAALKAGIQTRRLSSQSRRLGFVRSADLSRTQGNFQGSFDLPITSVRNDVLAGLGNLSANFNIAIDELSDFGTLTTLGYGFNWAPADAVQLIVSATNEDGAPSIQQLGEPAVITPNVRVFDFVTGETVDIARIDGGNAALVADNRRVLKFGATVKPVPGADLTLTANFIDSRTTNPIAAFPTATAELEAAFPDRFRRDANGHLFQIDNRPVNFVSSNRQELRWGINFSEPLEPTKADRAAAAARRAAAEAQRAAGTVPPGSVTSGAPAQTAGNAPRNGGVGFGGQGGGFGGQGSGRGARGLEGRLQLSLFHTWHLQDQIVIRDGLPVLDLLNGSATGSRGGQPRHEIEARAGIGKNGLGARINVNWQSGTSVLTDPTGATTSPGDLFFSDLATVNLRLFADLGQRRTLVRRAPWLRGARISLSIDNMTNARLGVRDRGGDVPVGYQPDLVDPLGRTLTLSFRKLFF